MAFGALARAVAAKHTKHEPAAVTPVIFSAGGALQACDDELLPCPEDRNGTGACGAEHDSYQVRVQDCDPVLGEAG